MNTVNLVMLALSAAGPVLAALAHYRLNKAQSSPAPSNPSAPAQAPRLGDGHVLVELGTLLSLLRGQPAQAPVAPVTPPAPSDTTSQLVKLLAEAQQALAGLAQLQATPPLVLTPQGTTSPLSPTLVTKPPVQNLADVQKS